MKRIIFLFLPFLPYLASAQVAKDTVTVLTLAQIPAGAIRDTTNFTFVQDNAFNKARFDSLARYVTSKLIGDRGDVDVSGATGLNWTLDTNSVVTVDIVDSAVTARKLGTASVGLASSTVTGTLPVTRGGTGTPTQFTAGSIVFAGASGVYSENNSRLFWNNSNNRLGINTSSPQAALHLEGGGEAMRFRAATASSAPFMSFYASDSVDASNAGILYRSFETNTNRYYLTYYGGTNGDGFRNAFTLYQYTSRANANISRVRMLFSDNGDFAVGKITDGSTLAGSTFVVKDGGNVGVGVAAPASKLQVDGAGAFANGTAALPTVTNTGNTDTGMWFPAADVVGFSTSGVERLRVKANGQVRFIPLAADPAGAENGDVYYNSATNKLRVYANGTWVDLH